MSALAPALVLSCEHAGNRVPRPYAELFRGRDSWLRSHRGWDPGTLELGRRLAEKLGVPLHWNDVTRLLIDNNRSLDQPDTFSELSRALPEDRRREIIQRYYTPHRSAIETSVEQGIELHGRVLHLGIHSFTPSLNGQERPFDAGWLYDPARPLEHEAVSGLIRALEARRPDLVQRRNEPYLGTDDGLTTTLRTRFPADRYLGIELEINQLHPLGPPERWRGLIEDICRAVEDFQHQNSGI